MNIGLFGGTFNPVHKGHENLLRAVKENVGLDKIIVMPDKIPPHKQVENLVCGEDRLNMVKLAFSKYEGVEFSDYELNRKGKSYSIYTIRHFHEIYPNDKLFFIMGSDMLLSFEKWYCYKEILSKTSLICVSRSDEDTNNLEPFAQKLREKGGEIFIVKAKVVDISSSKIRELLEKNLDCSCYLDENVVQYIVDKKLY